MAIAKNPRRSTVAAIDHKAAAFISGAGKRAETNKKPTMIRIDPDLLRRIDSAAKRLGISRSAFIVSAAARSLEE